MSPPNIVYIHSHDTGRYVQPYGHAIPTPHIQQLAEEGVLFRQAFCANPTCSPSRACLLTGQWAHSCGMTGLVNRGWTLPHPERLLTHTLQKAGYTTAMAGFQHVVADINDGGFTRLLPQEAPDAQTEDRAAAFLAEDHQAPSIWTWALAKPIASDAVSRPSLREKIPPIHATCVYPRPSPIPPRRAATWPPTSMQPAPLTPKWAASSPPCKTMV